MKTVVNQWNLYFENKINILACLVKRNFVSYKKNANPGCDFETLKYTSPLSTLESFQRIG